MPPSIDVILVDPDPGEAGSRLESADGRLSVATAGDAETARSRLAAESVDCLVSAHRLPETTGVAFLETVESRWPAVPTVLFVERGSEAIASDAVSAGITEYVSRERVDRVYATLADRILACVDGADHRGDSRLDRYRVLVDAMSDAACLYDADGRLALVNENLADIYGTRPAEIEGRESRLLERIRAESTGDPFGELVDGERSQLCGQVELTVGDDSSVLEYRLSRVTADGEFDGVVCVTRDVTARAERERELERYETFVEESTDAITLVDDDGRIVFQNGAVEPVLGYESSEIVGESVFEFVHPDDRTLVEHGLSRLADEDDLETGRIEYRVQRADGSYCWVESTGNDHRDTTLEGYVITSRDITERRRREAALSELHAATRSFMDAQDTDAVAEQAVETARSVLDLSINGLWLYDEGADALVPEALTDRGEELLGEPPTYDSGESLSWEAFQSGEAAVYDDLDSVSGLANPDTDIRSEIVLPIGEYGVMNVGSTERQAFDSIDVSLARILADTTRAALARADRERDLRRQRRELRRQNARLDEFASVISHDLRNPLTTAMGRLELLATDASLPASAEQHLSMAESALERMDRLIERTLTLARNGQTVGEVEPVDLERVARECWATVDAAEATLRVDDPPTVEAGPERLQHLFENLFRNAVEHGSTSPDSQARQDAVEHGSASPDSDESADGGPSVTVTVGGTDEGFYVADDGPGIPPEEREDVFDTGYTTENGGTGLGLAIVSQIVAAHGWEITVSDSDSGGARFEITGVDTVA